LKGVVPQIRHCLRGGDHGNRPICGKSHQLGRILVCEQLARIEKDTPFGFEHTAVLPAINQPACGGHDQLKTAMRIDIVGSDPCSLRGQLNDLVWSIRETLWSLAMDDESFFRDINGEQIGPSVVVNIYEERCAGTIGQSDRLPLEIIGGSTGDICNQQEEQNSELDPATWV
jgi:hypothetical protein